MQMKRFFARACSAVQTLLLCTFLSALHQRQFSPIGFVDCAQILI